MSGNADDPTRSVLEKIPTGIHGFDEVTGGGLPKGRPTLVCGGAGCGKTVFAVEFLVRGATQYDEPGVLVAFEETPEELTQNIWALGFDLRDLIKRESLTVDHVHIERNEIEETGDYDLEGLFVRLGLAIDTIQAKRVVLDTIEVLFSGLSNEAILRSEIRRLFRWLKEKGVTTVVTGERGARSLTRHGLEEYVSDCVILLDHRVNAQISTRRLRIVKYRGSAHGTNEFPFLIDERGVSVVPITSAGMDHPATDERISTGIADLDEMLGGKGFFRGSSVLVSGTAGAGKTSLGAQFAMTACARGERCMFFSFEESRNQLIRNLRSIGLHLEVWIEKGLLRLHAARPTFYGLETHLVQIHKLIDDFNPAVVVADPISNFSSAGTLSEAGAMLVRLVDFIKQRGATSLLTDLTQVGSPSEQTETGISSIVDTWVLLRQIEQNGQREGTLHILKSRGMAHSREVRGFRITDDGIRLTERANSAAGSRADPDRSAGH